MQSQTAETPVMISKQKAASLLNVCDDTVVNYYKKGLLPGFRVGKFLRFREEDVRTLLTTGSASKNSY